MLKPEILDPQGQAVQRALPRLGFDGISDVRQGKRFELEVDGPVDDAALARIHDLAESFLANTVIEDFTVKVEEVAEAANAPLVLASSLSPAASTTLTPSVRSASRAPNRSPSGTRTRTSIRSTP